MVYNYNKLLGRIIERCGTQYNFAKKMKLSERTISLKLSGKIEFKQSEIDKACEILQISKKEIAEYFFSQKVQFDWTLKGMWNERITNFQKQRVW